MAQFATAEDFAMRMGLDLTEDEQDRADELLILASGLIQIEAKQVIELVEDDEITMPGTNDERITLPERPVIEVSSVLLDQTELREGSDWYLDRNSIVRLAGTVARVGTLIDDTWPSGSGFGSPTRTLEITYTHGYADIPLIVKGICLEAVVRVWVNPGAVAREQIGNESTVYDNMGFSPGGLLLTDNEAKQLHRFFGSGAASITIGG